jgi:hypothetical protein
MQFFHRLPVKSSQSQLTTDPTSRIKDLTACFLNTFMAVSSTASLGCGCLRRSSYIFVAIAFAVGCRKSASAPKPFAEPFRR